MIDYKDDKFSEILGDKLRSMEDVPPVGMFERIEQTLRAMESAEEPKKIVPLWNRPFVRGVAAALVAAMLTLVVVVALRDNAPAEMEIMAEQIVEELNEEPSLPTSEPTPEPEKVAMVASRIAKPAATTEIASLQMDREIVEPSVESQAAEVVAETATEEPQKIKKSERRRHKRTYSSRKNQQELEEYWRNALSEEPRQRGLAQPAEVGLYAQNVGFNVGHIERNNLANSPMMVNEQNATVEGGSYLSPTLVQTNNCSNLEHFMPVSAGVTVSYTLNDWLSVDSGLLYTNLYSKSDSSGALSSYGRRRTLDYLGVPLALSAYFADFDRLSLYGRLGGTVELNINAKDKIYMDGECVEKVALDVPALTFSVDVAVGATYALWGGMGLFGEVGCAYWIAPAGYVENYRTVHPLSLSTRFGLRFAFN